MANENPGIEYKEGVVPEAELAASLGKRLMPAVIAIDGPAASGKSTVGFRLAEKLGYLFFDTGVMYRAVTWAALEHGLDVNDSDAVGDLAERLSLDIVPATGSRLGGNDISEENADGRHSTVLVDGRDVTSHIRSGHVDRHVSAVSAHKRVRSALTRHQRRIGLQYSLGAADKAGIVMVGRDIGTVVMTEAPVKIFLDATPEERARRRYEELAANSRLRGNDISEGVSVDYSTILLDIIRRDKIDSSRSLSPLQIADDATVLDTTDLAPAQVVHLIMLLLQQTIAAQGNA